MLAELKEADLGGTIRATYISMKSDLTKLKVSTERTFFGQRSFKNLGKPDLNEGESIRYFWVLA